VEDFSKKSGSAVDDSQKSPNYYLKMLEKKLNRQMKIPGKILSPLTGVQGHQPPFHPI
jgi:hypothetical protein